MGWLGIVLLAWFLVSVAVAPLIGGAVKRLSNGYPPPPPAPLTRRPAAPAIADVHASVGATRPVVLVVDDDPLGRLLTALHLSRAGYDALEATGESLPVGVRVDAIVVDHASIDSGDEIRRWLSAQSDHAPPVLVAQSADDPAAWVRAGADDYITKPFSSDELVARLDLQLRRGTAWRRVLESQAEEHAAVSRVMEATAGISEPMTTAAALCDALNDSSAVTGTALVSFAAEGPTVLATSGDPPWNVAEGPIVGPLAETLVRAAETGPGLALDELAHRGDSGASDSMAAVAPLGSSARPLGLLAARLAPSASEAAQQPEPATEGTGLATTIHLAGIATDLLRRPLEHATGDTTERLRLQQIVREGSFRPVFQPIVDLTDGCDVGYEVLTRFADGADPGARFQEAAALGVGLDLELATLRMALEHAERVSADRFVAFNVSASLLLDDGDVRELFDRFERPAVVELSEHEAIADYDAVRAALHDLNDDVRVSVDDAGSGFASLRHILLLRPDFVKLDRSWVHGVHDDPARQALIAGVAYFVKAIGAALLAEGVEEADDRDVLVDLGVQFGQGWLFGRPQPIEVANARGAG